MAILNTCCCWKSIRRANYACAVYSMLYYAFLVACLWIYIIDMRKPQDQIHEPTSILLPLPNQVVEWVKYLVFTVLVLSLLGPLTSILLIIGIFKDKKLLLLPWISDGVAILVLEILHVGYIIYENWTNANPAVAMIITVDFFSFVLNVYTILCVISQLQEYNAGRGTAEDERLLYGSAQFSRRPTFNSYDTGRRTTGLYESKAQMNGAFTSQNRMSIRSNMSRGPSIKISKIENTTTTPDLSGNNVQTSSESCEAEVTTGHTTCHGSETGDNSSLSQENMSGLLVKTTVSRAGSKKRVQFPNGGNSLKFEVEDKDKEIMNNESKDYKTTKDSIQLIVSSQMTCP